MQDVQGHSQVITVTLTASGSQTIQPLLSNEVYKNVSITVTPVADIHTNFRHQIVVYLDGLVSKTQNYTTANRRDSSYFSYYDFNFPPNVGLKTRPKLGFDPGFLGFQLKITNSEPTSRTFTVQTSFEALVGSQIIKR